MAGGKGERLYPLTRDRAKPAVPFGGTHRIIDFTISNCVNSDIRKIYILTQYKSLSLDRHIQRAWNFLSSRIGEFVHRHTTLKMLALSFLILISVVLIADGLGTELSKGYIYFTMAFALIVEVLNMRIRSTHSRRIVAT